MWKCCNFVLFTFCFLRVIREILFKFTCTLQLRMDAKFEDLGSEESGRSIESEDLQRDEVSDLFDNAAEVYSGDQRENPRTLSTTRGEGVPILNILGRPRAGSQESDVNVSGNMIKRVGSERARP